MDISKINGLLGEFAKLRKTEQNKIQNLRKTESPVDKVDLSNDAAKQNILSLAQQSILDLQTSLVNTLTDSKSKGRDDLYKALSSSADSFAQNNFSILNPEIKNEVQSLFSDMSKTSGGMGLASLFNETFGSNQEYGDIINQISSNLNKYS